MKKYFAIGFLLIISSFSWGQIPKDTFRVYTLKEALEVNADEVFSIDLSKGKLTELPAELERFKNLKSLNLSRNKLTALPDFFTEFTQLEFIYISRNKLTAFPYQLFYLFELRYLDLSRNEISSIPAGIENLKKLTYLDVWNNSFTFIDPVFAKLQQLEEVDFRGFAYSASFVERWVNAFPNTKVRFDPPCKCLD